MALFTGWVGRVAGDRLRRARPATASPGRDVGWRCVEGRRGGPGVRSVAWSGVAGSDDHDPPRIAVTDGSRESQPSGLELLPDLTPRAFDLGGLTITPQLAVWEGALGCWPALREVFLAVRQPRGRGHQRTNLLNKLPRSIPP
jgi:hypothetical protein